MKFILTIALISALHVVRAQTPVSPSASAVASVPARSAVERAVIETEKQRFAAQVNKDIPVLERVLADDLVYTHSHGGSDTKQSYIQAIQDGKSKYDAMDALEQNVRVYGNTAVINGKCRMQASSNGETVSTVLRYTDVYVRKGKQWQLVAWQSLKVPN